MKYHLSSRILHWLMAAIILFLIGLGIYMVDFLGKEAPNRMDIYNLHKSLGALILILIFARIANRLIHKAPALPKTMLKSEVILANISHGLLYVLMIIVPLSGYLMSNFFGYSVKFFSLGLPSIVEKNIDLGKVFHKIHEIAPLVLLTLVTLHVLAVIKHRFFDKAEHDVLKRMI